MFKFAFTLVGAALFAGVGFTVGGAFGADKPAAPAAAAPTAELNESIGCPGCNHPQEPDSATVAASAPAEAPRSEPGRPLRRGDERAQQVGAGEDHAFVVEDDLEHVLALDFDERPT